MSHKRLLTPEETELLERFSDELFPQLTWTHERGYLVYKPTREEKFRYADTDELVKENTRPCKQCGVQNWDGPDPCIGHIDGAKNACCGHGVPGAAYVSFENGLCIRGNFKHKDI